MPNPNYDYLKKIKVNSVDDILQQRGCLPEYLNLIQAENELADRNLNYRTLYILLTIILS